jgi:hypothetical protein
MDTESQPDPEQRLTRSGVKRRLDLPPLPSAANQDIPLSNKLDGILVEQLRDAMAKTRKYEANDDDKRWLADKSPKCFICAEIFSAKNLPGNVVATGCSCALSMCSPCAVEQNRVDRRCPTCRATYDAPFVFRHNHAVMDALALVDHFIAEFCSLCYSIVPNTPADRALHASECECCYVACGHQRRKLSVEDFVQHTIADTGCQACLAQAMRLQQVCAAQPLTDEIAELKTELRQAKRQCTNLSRRNRALTDRLDNIWITDDEDEGEFEHDAQVPVQVESVDGSASGDDDTDPPFVVGDGAGA